MTDFRDNIPEAFFQRIQAFSRLSRTQITHAFTAKPYPAFRVNTLKITPNSIKQKLSGLITDIEEVPWYKSAFVLKNQSPEILKKLMDSPFYKEGLIYKQSLASMLPALILNPAKGEKILDITAAPGSKTTQIASLMRNTGQIIANDISRVRMYKLKDNLHRQGVKNTLTTSIRAEFFWKKYPLYFDKALLDAPCSLEGRINLNDPKTYNNWSPNRIKILAMRERYMLRSALSSIKPGGIVVYSTCTLAPEENEQVLDWILIKEKNSIAIEPFTIKGLSFDKPVMRWGNKNYDPQVQNSIRIFPSSYMEGFFIAKIKKLI